MNAIVSFARRFVGEPAVHFLCLGALLFAFAELKGSDETAPNVISVPAGQIDSFVSGFSRTWHRPPTELELKTMIDEHVREEIASREAIVMGLDRDDTIVRRRLRQKFEFLIEDTSEAVAPTDDQLKAWLDANAAKFETDPQIGFRQVHLSAERRGEALRSDAQELLGRLAAAGPAAEIEALGDSRMLPQSLALSERSDIVSAFGKLFAAAIFEAPVGQWSGPISSDFGLHIVFVSERQRGRIPELQEIRPLVLREFVADRRRRALDEVYAQLLSRYRVVVQKPPPNAGISKP
jgi:hypothetical protein